MVLVPRPQHLRQARVQPDEAEVVEHSDVLGGPDQLHQ
jgi:hypothetical protein